MAREPHIPFPSPAGRTDHRASVIVLLWLMATACGDDGAPDASMDGALDASARGQDAGQAADAGVAPDAGRDVTAGPDAATEPDAGPTAGRDAGTPPEADAGSDASRPPPQPPDPDYDPLAYARRNTHVVNREAVIPPQCYTKTEGEANPCWTCHTRSTFPNDQNDLALQEAYSFSDFGLTNHWTNLFVDRSARISEIGDDEILAYVRQDNYTTLGQALANDSSYQGYVLDLDFRAGFDDDGWARDGSEWRAFRYKPFLGTFWPTNGSTDDVIIRLPQAYRTTADGQASRMVHAVNLAIVEASLGSDPALGDDEILWPTEPLDETVAGMDLDGNGALGTARHLEGLPAHYAGAAADQAVRRRLYPGGVEFLHSVRYIDPDEPNLIATRMKELRYSRKLRELDTWSLLRAYELERNEKQDENALPRFGGTAETGLTNAFGWQLQGFIEDAQGRLRLQSREEHTFCMGCHSTAGITIDQTFAFARKVPGEAGWGYQDVAGIPDVPQVGHEDPEILTYFERVGGGDEFRANDEVLSRFFPDGMLDAKEVRRAAPGGDHDIGFLIGPSRERALLLNKAYKALVEEQRFERGRDAIIQPPENVHAAIENGSTDLAPQGLVYADGQLQLTWPEVTALMEAAQ